MADFKPAPRVTNALDNRKLNLSAPGVDQGKRASLIWGLYSNNPRITVWTGGESEGRQEKIAANLDLPVFYAFLNLLNKTLVGPNGAKSAIENMGFTFPGGKRSEKPSVLSELWVGKDDDGSVWISVTAYNRPKIKFYFVASDFHHFKKGDGTPFSKAEINNLFAEGYVKLLENMMATMACNNWVPPVPRDNNGGGGNRGGYGGGGGNGGGNRSQPRDLPEDDLPF